MQRARSASGSRSRPGRFGLGGLPQAGEGLTDDAVPAAAGLVGAAHQAAPRPVALAEPPRLDAEQLGLPARVADLLAVSGGRPRPGNWTVSARP